MLFVLVAIASVPLGWSADQLNWIRRRHEFIDRPMGTYNFVEMYSLNGPVRYPPPKCPWSLRLFGEKDYDLVLTPSATKQEARDLFPEAYIKVIHSRLERDDTLNRFGAQISGPY